MGTSVETTYTIGNDKSIHAAGDGIITEARYQFNEKDKTGWGNTILVKHFDENGNPTYTTRYAHLKDLPSNIVGQKVNEGEVIGTMGATGGVKGAHLHFEVKEYNPQSKTFEYKNPKSVNVGKYETLNDIPK